ncbi:MAG: hypothetical protein NZV14_06785 [Bryobacteraceae bacterium]|nr:hypothetical protein [Bryobacteraceae bacterium]MDW8377848.1 hypothetical protein [Bryobacterales bacterium]
MAVLALSSEGYAQSQRDPGRIFRIGSYELPAQDSALRQMAEAGFNLVRCESRADLDRLARLGLDGWIPLPLTASSDQVRKKVAELADHPALAVWEGPDEMIWNFTAFSGLYPKVHSEPGEWQRQTPNALAYARAQGSRVLAAFRDSVRQLRQLDPHNRPLWLNEAAESDVKYIREILPELQVLGADLYPIRSTGSEPAAVGDVTRRYVKIAKGRPVWMVLQGFSWHVFPERKRSELYPSFLETRFMAWDAIVNGARGVLYWGTVYIPQQGEAFRQSLYAMAAELAALQAFLRAPNAGQPAVELIESNPGLHSGERGVKAMLRQADQDWLLAVVNEDSRPHLAVDISGLHALEGRKLELLYEDDAELVQEGSILVRMRPLEVKLYCTSRRFETQRRQGRSFPLP